MGLKYVEHIKSAVLLLLILLSITLTFSIWTFRPNYQPIEQTPTADVTIAEKQKLSDVILPYKLIAISGDGITGTTDTEDIGTLMEFMKTWSFQNLAEADKEVTKDEADSIISQPDTVTLFFRSSIPFGVVDSLFQFGDTVTTEASFNQIVIETQSDTGLVHFIGKAGGRRFTAHATGVEPERLNSLLAEAKEIEPYSAVKRETARTLYLPSTRKSVSNMTFFQQEEVKPSDFRYALFPADSLVQREPTGEHSERYFDFERQMDVDTQMKTLRFNNTKMSADSAVVSIPSELLLDSLDFVNEHGGWTNDFVLSSMDPMRNQIKYRMEIGGYPVFSEITLTEITLIWGSGGISNYARPYYQLDEPLPETTEKRLPAGTDVAEELRTDPEIDFDDVNDIIRGYQLHRDDKNNLYILDPAWFYEENGEWHLVKKAGTGGGMGGLE